MALFQGFARSARRTEEFLKSRAVCRAKHGLAVIPCHWRAFIPVTEIVQLQFEPPIPFEPDQLSQLIGIRGLAIRSQAHHFVFVAKLKEAQVLGYGQVDKPERMRK